MQIYKIPYNYRHEEKIFGGYLSLRQALYLILAIVSISILFIPFINMFFKSIVFVTLATMFLLFAFLKVDDTNADKYFTYIIKFMTKNKIYILEKGKDKC